MSSPRLWLSAFLILEILLFSNASAQVSTSPVIKQQLTGLTWNGSSFIASYGEFTSHLLNVSLDGRTVTPFAPTFTGWNETYVAIGDGSAGFPKGAVYVSSNQSIYQVNPSGDAFSVFSRPPGVSRIGFLAFDRVGTWGHALFAVDDSGLLWSIASNGTAKVIQDFGKGVKPEGIVVAPESYGTFGGYLFVSLEYAEKIVAIPPNDTSRVVTAAQIQGEAPERIMTIPPNSDLYIAKWMPGNILRVPAANLSRYAGSMVLITEGDSQANGSVSVLSATGSSVTQTKIYLETDHPHFEAADFVAAAPSQTSGGPGGSSEGIGGLGGVSAELVGVAVVVLAVAAVIAAMRRQSRT